jgi:hypothetical protein
MSNLAFITTKKYLSSYDISSFLLDIDNKRFGRKLSIACDPNNGIYTVDWFSSDLKQSDGFDIRVVSKRKLSIKWPTHPYTVYMFIVFKHELAKMMDGVLSDESDDERHSPNPDKYPSYEEWVKLRFASSSQEFKMELKLAPKGLEKF